MRALMRENIRRADEPVQPASTPSTPSVPVSWGELIDEIKSVEIASEAVRANVRDELLASQNVAVLEIQLRRRALRIEDISLRRGNQQCI